MDLDEYRKCGKEMVDYIADYLETIRDRRVFPDVKPGYMRTMLPESAPVEGEEWNKIFMDVERVIMPGITHWQSPHMHAYFPALNSGPSLLGDMLADAINCLGFTWASSPACTELETIVMNWLGKMIGLPDTFLHLTSMSKGGGVIQTTASEATLVCLLAGRTQAIRRFHEHTPGLSDAEINARLVAYCSDQAHSSVEKAALIGLVQMRYIESDENLSLRGAALQDAIEDDIKLGLIPFWVCATLGTTGACSFDNLEEVGTVCLDYNLWLHVDAAYAGSAFICPEYRRWLKGIEKADSIAFNPSKWLMVHFDCTAMWVKNSGALHRTFNVEPLYLQHENSGLAIDYMHWQIPLSKRFRSLKLWFVIRKFGIKGLQKHIREGVRLAQKFEALVLADQRFEIPAARHLGMVVFRIKGENDLTEKLLKRLNHGGKLHCVPSSLKGKYVIRFTVTSPKTTNDDIIKDWTEIRHVTTDTLQELNVKVGDRARVPLKDTRAKNEAFGSSLLLANSPMSPKIVNGSFAAIFDTEEFFSKAFGGIRITSHNSPAMRRRVKGILMSGKQFSLDSRMDLVFHGIDSGPNNQKDDFIEMDGIDKPKAITEDGEESWEVCENAPQDTLADDGIHCDYLSPILNDHRYHRSRSIDAAFLDRNRLGSSLYSNGLATFHSEPTKLPNSKLNVFNNDNLFSCSNNSLSNSENNKTDSMFYNRPFVSSVMHNSFTTPNKTFDRESLDGLLRPPRANKRTSSMFPLEFAKNSYPEKRQSDPHIRYAFYNKGFEVNPTFSRRYSSQLEFSKSAMPNIDEFYLEDTPIDWHRPTKKIDEPSASMPLPKFRIKISDECGQRVPSSFDSDSDCDLASESAASESQFFDEFFSDAKLINDQQYDQDPFDALFEQSESNNKIVERDNCCTKCGHQGRHTITRQFSSCYE